MVLIIVTGLYIVKNEAGELERSIRSIMDICDEIVVVDTGSEDNTVETAKSLGAVVHHFDWVDDFSKARNFALSKANGDLIIFIDADEWFPESLNGEDRTYLEGLVSEGYRVFGVLRSNIMGEIIEIPNYNTRMLRGKAGLSYFGAIHESINDIDGSYYLPERFLLYHSGYDNVLAEKSTRNLNLLHRQIETETEPAMLMLYNFYIARESGNLGIYVESLNCIDAFFRLWHKTPNSRKYMNVGIMMYRQAVTIYTRVPEEWANDSKFRQHCESFVRDFPNHPASHCAMASYLYLRQCDYGEALKYIKRVEETAKTYDIKDYPHDQVGAESPKADAMLIKGNILFDRGDRGGAFDCYASVLRKVQPNADFLRKVLHLIKDQPTQDVAAFLSAIPENMTVQYVELLLQQLVYFPQLREVYMHFSVQHLKMTRQRTDISAVAALLSGNSYGLVADVARSIADTDPMTAGKLLILAAVCSGDPEIRQLFPPVPQADRILDSYFSGIPIAEISNPEINLFARVLPVVIFACDTQARDAFLRVLENLDSFLSYIILHYCGISGDSSQLLPFVRVDADTLEPMDRAAFFLIMGKVNITSGEYEDAMFYLRQSFELNPGNPRTRRAINLLASVSPAHAGEARGLTDIAVIEPVAQEEDSLLRAISSAFDG